MAKSYNKPLLKSFTANATYHLDFELHTACHPSNDLLSIRVESNCPTCGKAQKLLRWIKLNYLTKYDAIVTLKAKMSIAAQSGTFIKSTCKPQSLRNDYPYVYEVFGSSGPYDMVLLV